MVLLFKLAVVAASALSVCSAAAPALDDYAVPAVDFAALSSSSAASRASLLRAMQTDGIVALQNVPGYASLRTKYLAKAASCAVTARENKAEFLLFRKLTDGTQRFTISTESGRKLQESGKETLEHCPGYSAVYHEFSQLVEDAVTGVGKALDATKALQIQTGSDEKLTARELMEDSVHLDHFHAYQAAEHLPRKLSSSKSDSQLSLEMHTDNGLLIAMTAPEYFDVADSGEVRAKQTRSEDAGLVIQTSAGKTVRPVLKADELVLMLGSGADQWITTSPKLHPVMHGMRFPRGLSYADDTKEHKVLRAWFGKMILLKADHVMKNTGLSYEAYANHTTRYLMETSADLGFAAVACPPDRRLQASDNKCMTKICTPKAGADTSKMTESCQVTCNHEAAADVATCQQNCECETQSVAGHRCWMLCVEDLAADVCTGAQKCNTAYQKSKLAMTCADGTTAATTTAPATTTVAPATTTPASTPKPTPSPVTVAPKKTAAPAAASSEDGNGKVVAPVLDTSKASSSSRSADTLIAISKNATSASSTAGSVPSTKTKESASGRGVTMASFSVGVASLLAAVALAMAQN